MKLNSNRLKLIAISAMTLDHLAWKFFPGCSREILALIMHAIGRITCPIMCYFIAEGYYYTRDINRYTVRLFVFAAISHVPYMLMFGNGAIIPFETGVILNQTSVIWSLACGLVMLRIANSGLIKKEWQRDLLIVILCLLAFPADWSCIASLCILAIGTNRGDFKAQMKWMLLYVGMYSVVYALTIDMLYGILQMSVALSIPLLKCYNGERGRNRKFNSIMKWLFYIYYPLHLLLLVV